MLIISIVAGAFLFGGGLILLSNMTAGNNRSRSY